MVGSWHRVRGLVTCQVVCGAIRQVVLMGGVACVVPLVLLVVTDRMGVACSGLAAAAVH